MSQDTASPAAPTAAGPDVVQQEQSAFVARLASYSVVNSTWNSVLSGYNAVKGYSPYLKAGLETAEAAGQKVVGVATPVVVALNEKYNLDEKGVRALDKAERTAEGLKAAASDAKTKVVGVVTESKDMAQSFIETNPRPFNQLLDVTETLVNKILPPALQQQPVAIEGQGVAEPEAAGAPQPGVIARAANLGADVSNRVQTVVIPKLTITFRSPSEIAEMTHVVDLIQYAAQYIDVEAQKARLTNAAEAVKQASESSKAKAAELVEQAKASAEVVKQTAEAKVSEAVQNAKSAAAQAMEKAAPVKKVIEDATADLHDFGVRSTVAVVASIAHATEVVRRRALAARSLDVNETRAALQSRLAEVIQRTKAYTSSLNEAQLRDYVNNVRSQSGAALASLITLVNSTSVASSAISLREQLSSNLFSWSNSLAGRLGYQIVPVAVTDAPKDDDDSAAETSAKSDSEQ